MNVRWPLAAGERLMRICCILSASLLLCTATGASEPAPPPGAADPLQGLTKQEREKKRKDFEDRKQKNKK